MKQRILKITPEELIRTIQNKTTPLELPTDTELIDIKYDAYNRHVLAVIRSDTFEDLTEGTPTPEHTKKTPAHKQQTNPPTTQPTINTTPQKPLIQTLTTQNQLSTTSKGTGVKTLGSKAETNIDTCGFEDEFTKEQRKVLKFTSEGDYVIVKPTQFLKTEWEDINDTVKSIGGKWVKGPTIDYWAIPKNPKQVE